MSPSCYYNHSKNRPKQVALSQVIILKITANQICLKMSSAGLSPILPIFCDVCAQDFNSVDTAVTHFTFKKHWTVRNSCVKPAIFIPGKTFKIHIFSEKATKLKKSFTYSFVNTF